MVTLHTDHFEEFRAWTRSRNLLFTRHWIFFLTFLMLVVKGREAEVIGSDEEYPSRIKVTLVTTHIQESNALTWLRALWFTPHWLFFLSFFFSFPEEGGRAQHHSDDSMRLCIPSLWAPVCHLSIQNIKVSLVSWVIEMGTECSKSKKKKVSSHHQMTNQEERGKKTKKNPSHDHWINHVGYRFNCSIKEEKKNVDSENRVKVQTMHVKLFLYPILGSHPSHGKTNKDQKNKQRDQKKKETNKQARKNDIENQKNKNKNVLGRLKITWKKLFFCWWPTLYFLRLASQILLTLG